MRSHRFALVACLAMALSAHGSDSGMKDPDKGASPTEHKLIGVWEVVKSVDLPRRAACGCPQTAATCRELIAHEPKLWAFVWHQGVESTNNAAERALRHAVLWRKGSGGTDRQRGSRFVERGLSVRESCRQQSRGLMEYLVASCQARLDGSRPPSLLSRRTPEAGVA